MDKKGLYLPFVPNSESVLVWSSCDRGQQLQGFYAQRGPSLQPCSREQIRGQAVRTMEERERGTQSLGSDPTGNVLKKNLGRSFSNQVAGRAVTHP